MNLLLWIKLSIVIVARGLWCIGYFVGHLFMLVIDCLLFVFAWLNDGWGKMAVRSIDCDFVLFLVAYDWTLFEVGDAWNDGVRVWILALRFWHYNYFTFKFDQNLE